VEDETDTTVTPIDSGPVATEQSPEFTQAELAQIDAQSGNPVLDIASGNVPLGSLRVLGAWSLLSLFLSCIAIIAAAVVLLSTLLRRRRDDEGQSERFTDEEGRDDSERTRRRSLLLKVLATIAGILTPIVWLILDDLTLPMAWINRWTIFVAFLFIVEAVLIVAYVITTRRNARESDEDERQSAYGRAL
jgi:amino acid transporter